MKRFGFTLFFLMLFFWAVAQDMPLQFNHLTVQDGLSRSYVKCLLQDRTGYLWIGTADGLNKYDGISFKTYKYISGIPNSLNHNVVNTIFEDSRGELWVGTQTGINLYNRERDEFVPLSAIQNYVRCIVELDNGLFLVGSPGGLYLFDPKKRTSRQLYNNIAIEDILRDKQNNYWLASHKGLLHLNTSNFLYTNIAGMGHNTKITGIVRSLLQDKKGRIWIGTDTEGLFLMTNVKENATQVNLENYSHNQNDSRSLSKGALLALAEDNDENLWIGIENGGICILSLKTIEKTPAFRHVFHNPVDFSSLSNNSIHTIYKDKQQTLWIGTYGGGISYYNPLLQRFAHFRHISGTDKSINNNHINVIFEEDNYLWIGTEGGLNVFDKREKKFRYYTSNPLNPASIGSDAVWSICRDSRNNLWVGTWGGGLNLFNEQTKTFTHFYHSPTNATSIGGNNVYDIIEDRNKQLWIALMPGGLNRFEYSNNTFEQFVVDFDRNSISCNWVNDLLESADGNMWVSTTEALDFFNKKNRYFTSFTNKPKGKGSISYNGAVALFEDSRKNIWIGTSNGLNLFIKSDSTFKCYREADGLANNSIKAICEDNNGNLWLSTSSGITKFVDAINIPQRPVFKNYTVSDGSRGIEFNGRSVFKNKQGHIYFGSTNGYFLFHPENIVDNPNVPNIVFTNLLIYNKTVKVGEENSPLKKDISVTNHLELTHKHGVFTIEFAALNFLAPQNNQYAYILEGFENNWNYVGNQRSATYTNLDPGDYVFRVKASNNDGLWNESGITLKITIGPAWYQTWVARAIYLLIILLLVYFFRKHTIISVNLKNELWLEHIEKKKSEELNQMKLQFLTNISHELRTPLTLIIAPLKKLIGDAGSSEQLSLIYRNASRLKMLVDQIMDFSKIENHMMKLSLQPKDVVEVIKTSIDNFKEYAFQKRIELVFTSNVEKCVAEIDEDKMDKIVTNIISNAVKNTPEGGRVSTFLNYNQYMNMLEISVADTGRGIAPEDIGRIFDRFYTSADKSLNITGTGIGLDLTRKLVELHCGKIDVASTLGEGATFTVQLPVKTQNVKFNAVEQRFSQSEEIKVLNPDVLAVPEFLHDKTVLIIDDNPELCDFIASILVNEYNVIKENNPLEVSSHVLKHLPDLIISDVMMPGMSGFELCSQIKGDVRFSHIPVILLTAKVAVHDQITGYETGADDYIHKPFESELLKARVKNLIAKKESIRRQLIGSDGVINSKTEVNKLDITFIDQIMACIEKDFSNTDFNVNHIIDTMAMSRSVFYNKFKALSEQSIGDLITTFRLNKAETMLKNSDMSISEVALECGFSDPAYFSRVFKNKYNKSPKEYKSRLNEL